MRVIFVFPVHADFSGLLHFLLCCLSPRHPVKQLLIWFLLLRKYTAHSALHVLLELSFHFTTCWKKKLHLSSAPSPLGKTSISTDLLFPLGACPFWCLLLSLIGSYSSKSCQGSLEFLPRCVFSRMPRKNWDTQRESIQRGCKLGYLFLFKRPQNAKAWIRVLNKARSWLIKSALPVLLCH